MRELYRVYPARLSAVEIETIVSIAKQHEQEPGTIFSTTDTPSDIRSCSVQWLSDEWIRTLLWPYVDDAAQNGFGVVVNGKSEVQLATYSAETGGHYDWHHDVYWNGQSSSDRKLSVTVQLSRPTDYEGGDFEFEEIETNTDFRRLGTILIFPSYLRHRVSRVTSGTRRALIAWFFGPRWT